MARVRYAKSLRDLDESRRARPEAFEIDVRQIRCVYETDAEVAQAVVPRPLEPTMDPKVVVSFSQVSVPISVDVTRDVGVASFGVGVHYDGRDAIYPLTMAMTSEDLAIEGRERFGQPTKIARLEWEVGAERASARVERHGIGYLAVLGEFGEEAGARLEDEEVYCFKAFPGCQPAKGFDQDPQLVRLELKYRFDRVVRLEGALELVESAYDPVADLPVRRMVSLDYAEGHCRMSGRVLRPVPGEWLLPFLHQRRDEPANEGVEV